MEIVILQKEKDKLEIEMEKLNAKIDYMKDREEIHLIEK